MKRKVSRMIRGVSAVICTLAVALAGQIYDGAGAGLGTMRSYADLQADYAQQIKDKDAEIAKYEQQIKDAGADIEKNKDIQDLYWNKLVATQEKIDLVNLSVTNKIQEIADKEDEISAVELRISETEATIADKEMQIEMLDAQNRKNIERFGQIIHAMYITDSDDYLSIIAGSSDFYDIFVRSEIMKSVKEQNLRFMNQLLADIDRLRDDEAKLEQDKQQLQFDKLTLEQEKDDLIDAKTELDEKVKYYNDLNSGFWTEYNTVTAHINDLETKQANLKYLKKLTQADRDKIQAALEEEIRQAQLRAQNKAIYDTGEWVWPVNPQYHLITTYFGYDKWRGGNHGGIDIGNGGIMGANIYASKGGEVIVAKTTYIPGYDYGMYVVIDHGSGYQTLYAHCSAIYVSVGQMVNKGDCIAAVGSTGWSTGPHLHFEVRKDGTRIDPFSVVNLPQ